MWLGFASKPRPLSTREEIPHQLLPYLIVQLHPSEYSDSVLRVHLYFKFLTAV